MAKVSDRSLYRKIQVVVEEIGKGKISSLEAFLKAVQGHICFTYYKKEDEPKECNKKTIERVLLLAIQLGLIEENAWEVTEKVGARAVNREQFSSVLRQRIRAVLKSKGLPFDALIEAIQKILDNARSGIVPSWDNIYNSLTETYGDKMAVERKEFHTLLTLLSHADGIGYSQKRIYLPYKPE